MAKTITKINDKGLLTTHKEHLIMPKPIEAVEGFLNVPVIMMVEGVHNGSHGAILHQAETLSNHAQEWNGMPVVIKHPQDELGRFISANTEGVISIGTIADARFEDGKLRANLVLNEQTLIAQSPTAHQAIINNTPIDVSIGAYTKERLEEGQWNDEAYLGIAEAYVPDHLAILPGEVGACSWNDGCGIRVNSENKNKISMEKKHFELVNNVGESYQQRLEAMYSKINMMDNDMATYYLEDLYPDHVIYRKRLKNSGEPNPMYFKQVYNINSNGGIEFVGEPTQVRRVLDYIPIINNKEVKNMTKIEQKVDALIANAASGFTGCDRDFLLTQSEEVLDKMLPIAPEKELIEVNQEEALTEEKVTAFLTTYKDVDAAIKLMPISMQEEMQKGITAYREKRKALIAGITANKNNQFEEQELEAMPIETLEKFTKSMSIELVDYSGNGGTPQTPKQTGEAPLMPIS